MVTFSYKFKWTRFIIISSEGRDYVGAAEDIKNSIAKQAGRGYTIVHPYEEVKRNPPIKTIDDLLTSIKHEGRGNHITVDGDCVAQYFRSRRWGLNPFKGEIR